MSQAPRVTLNDGRHIPQLGLGLFQIQADSMDRVVNGAIDAGYRLFDTAARYGNEAAVGAAIRGASVARDELFVSTKLDRTRMASAADVALCFDESLDRLGLDYVDLYLIHWPQPRQDRFVEAWEVLVDLQRSGRARSIGVSNFSPDQVDRIVAATGYVPAVNQIELHPRFQQRGWRRYHAAHAIMTEAWAPLGVDLRHHETLRDIAQRHGRSATQVILRWHMQSGGVAIPRSSNAERIAANIALFDWTLDSADMAMIDALDDPAGRTGADPALIEP